LATTGQSNNSLNPINIVYQQVGTPPLPPTSSQSGNGGANNGSFKGTKQSINNRNANQSSGIVYAGSAGSTFFGGISGGAPLAPNQKQQKVS
jgi:hypothetical protein